MGTTERRARIFRQREQEILRAAGELIAQGDWRTVSVDAIARRAEVAKGTVYLHFRSKEEMIARLTIHHTKRLLGKLATLTAEEDLARRLGAYAAATLRHQRERPDWGAMAAYCRHPAVIEGLKPEVREELQGVAAALAALLDDAAEEAQARGLAPPGARRWMVPAAMRLLVGHAALSAPEAGADADGTEDEFAAFLGRFLLAGWAAGEAADAVEDFR